MAVTHICKNPTYTNICRPSTHTHTHVLSSDAIFNGVQYNIDWAALRCPPLSNGIGNEFYQATWDYVQDTRSGMAKWGDIKTWDTSAVITMDRALSSRRDAAGNAAIITKCPADYPYAYRPTMNLDYCCSTSADNLGDTTINANPDKSKRSGGCGSSNQKCPLEGGPCYDNTDTGDDPKGAAFNTDILLWDTSQVTSMKEFLYGATAFNGDVSAFDTSSVTSMSSAFELAQNFDGKAILTTTPNLPLVGACCTVRYSSTYQVQFQRSLTP